MRRIFGFVLLMALGVMACASQAKDPGWDPATEQKIAAGQVEPGMTKEMVTAALGKPTMVRTVEGVEIWEYDNYSRGSTTGFGAGQRDTKFSVHFKDGKVVMIKGTPTTLMGPVMNP